MKLFSQTSKPKRKLERARKRISESSTISARGLAMKPRNPLQVATGSEATLQRIKKRPSAKVDQLIPEQKRQNNVTRSHCHFFFFFKGTVSTRSTPEKGRLHRGTAMSNATDSKPNFIRAPEPSAGAREHKRSRWNSNPKREHNLLPGVFYCTLRACRSSQVDKKAEKVKMFVSTRRKKKGSGCRIREADSREPF